MKKTDDRKQDERKQYMIQKKESGKIYERKKTDERKNRLPKKNR